jgi:type IV secretion system protein VirB8
MKKPRIYTAEDYQQLANSIDDGSYFAESRKWYTLVYMYIMPERCVYIVFTALALTAASMVLLSLIMLNPIRPAVPLLFPMQNVLAEVPSIKKMRTSPYQAVNDAVQRFFLKEYVSRRENYSFDSIQTSFRFLRQHSTAEVMNGYRRFIDPSSVRSPINMYARKATRRIYLRSIIISRVDDGPINDYSEDREYYAEVYFVAVVDKEGTLEETEWKAQVTFDYQQLKVIQPEDLANEKPKITPMKFTVTDYSVIEAEEDEYKQE